eukprot:jgi/Undpi1/12128/HiC_scaffold_5.g01804.m1
MVQRWYRDAAVLRRGEEEGEEEEEGGGGGGGGRRGREFGGEREEKKRRRTTSKRGRGRGVEEEEQEKGEEKEEEEEQEEKKKRRARGRRRKYTARKRGKSVRRRKRKTGRRRGEGGGREGGYFRRSKLLYTDYYWKTTHRMTTRFIMQSDRYTRHVNDPESLAQTYEGVATRIVWATLLHPFDLLATRMITESRTEYSTVASSVRHVLKHRGVTGLFLGVRSSIFNVLLPFGNWYLLGVPFLIKTRRMLDGMDTVFRAGMGGSLDMVRSILKEEGIVGLFAGYRATLWGIGPAFLTLCGARLVVYMVMGSSTRTYVIVAKLASYTVVVPLNGSSSFGGQERPALSVAAVARNAQGKAKAVVMVVVVIVVVVKVVVVGMEVVVVIAMTVMGMVVVVMAAVWRQGAKRNASQSAKGRRRGRPSRSAEVREEKGSPV